MITPLQELTESLPPLLQWAGVAIAGAIPFVESYFGAVVGVIAGVNVLVAVTAAVIGNMVSMVGFVVTAHTVRDRVVAARGPQADFSDPPATMSRRRRKLRRAFDRYGVAVVSLFGQTILPSQITSAALVSFGARRKAVITWQAISICLWGVTFGALATLGADLTHQ